MVVFFQVSPDLAYATPRGTLRQEVYRAHSHDKDWPGLPETADEVEIASDYHVPRSRRFAVETEADLEALPYLLQPPGDADRALLRQEAARLKAEADRLGVLLMVWGPSGADRAIWLCGVENLMLMSMESPDMLERLLDVIHAHDKALVEAALETPADAVFMRGWYASSDFWSPAAFRRHILPRVREIAEMTHQAGKRLAFCMSTGMMPLLDALAEIGYDVHFHVDPVQGRADLQRVKDTLGRTTALQGGMNSAVTLESGSDAEIRQAVHRAVETCAPGGGFILSPVDCLFPSTPWRSVEVLIEAWREVRD